MCYYSIGPSYNAICQLLHFPCVLTGNVLQEGLLDMEVEFSDNSVTPLRDISLSDYSLVVDSLSPEVVAFAPNALSHPRVIAVGEGRGDLLRVALLTPELCRTGAAKRTPPLVSATAQVLTLDGLVADIHLYRNVGNNTLGCG